ncbi:hypothetical protein OH687_17240 [Burkholderia anthina]|nr:hypothetical protein OH687_17240 [Burkholderia anthina]
MGRLAFSRGGQWPAPGSDKKWVGHRARSDAAERRSACCGAAARQVAAIGAHALRFGP